MPSPSAAISPPWHHVFVDFENVHELDFCLIGNQPVTFTLMLGAKQTRLEVDLVQQLMKHAGSVQLVRLTSSGKNALDLALAYYVGRAAVVDPAGVYHIVSGDMGFDPLIEHLRSRHIRAHRHPDFKELVLNIPAAAPAKPAPTPPPRGPAPPDKLSSSPPPAPPAQRVLDHLRKNPNNRPKKEKTLLSHLRSHLGKTASAADAAGLLKKLKKEGFLEISDRGAVTYHLVAS